MNLSTHCNLCENRLFDINTGTRCNLTGQRPEFNNTCSDIKFGERIEKVISEVNIDLELIKRTKNISYGNFVVFLLISLAFIGSGVYLGIYLLTFSSTSIVISTVPFIIGGIGISILPKASGPLNKYRQGIAVANENKQKLDALLIQYNIEYNIDITVKKDLHGNIDTDSKTTFTRINYESKKTLNISS